MLFLSASSAFFKKQSGEDMKPKRARFGALLAALLLVAAAVTAQNAPKSPARSHLDAVHAMFDVHTFKQASISRDGNRVAWVEDLPGSGSVPSHDSAIFVADLNDPDHPIQITAGEAALPETRAQPRATIRKRNPSSPGQSPAAASSHEEHDVAWSPDSRRIAFLSDAE